MTPPHSTMEPMSLSEERRTLNSKKLHGASAKQTLVLIEQELWRRRCRKDLVAWSVEALYEQSQTPHKHHVLLLQELELIVQGKNDRLMVMMPPGSAKSTYCSVIFPAWVFGLKDGLTLVAASHTADLAERFGRKTRNLVDAKSDILGYALRDDSRAAGRWETTNGGEYFAVGVGGSVTGRRADGIIIDDPVKSLEAAESEVDREKVWEWYKSDLYTRLKPGGFIILVMTRWHEQDLAGKLIEEMRTGKGDTWRTLKLQAICEEPDDPMGRQTGEALWPEWEPLEALQRKRAAVGERQFGALFQGNPRARGTSFFDEALCLQDGTPVLGADGKQMVDYTGMPLFNKGLPVPLPVSCRAVYGVFDTAVKTGTKNDGSGIMFFALMQQGGQQHLVVLDWEIRQVQGALLEVWLPELFKQLHDLARICGAQMGSLGIWVEDKASGSILLQQAAKPQNSWPAHTIDSKLTAVGKDERAISISSYVQRRLVMFSDRAYYKQVSYKGNHGNHAMMQVFRFQLGVKDQADDLLDAFCYGVSIGLGDNEGV